MRSCCFQFYVAGHISAVTNHIFYAYSCYRLQFSTSVHYLYYCHQLFLLPLLHACYPDGKMQWFDAANWTTDLDSEMAAIMSLGDHFATTLGVHGFKEKIRLEWKSVEH